MKQSRGVVGRIGASGAVTAKVIPAGQVEARLTKAPSWPSAPINVTGKAWVRTHWKELLLHLRLARVGFVRGLFHGSGVLAASRLYATVYRKDGAVEHLGLISTKLIVDLGVAFLVDDWDNNGQDLTTMNFHGCGTGTNAENQTDSALQTESTTALNPDNTRATGTRSQPTAPQYRSVGTLTFDNTAAVTEHGLFSQSATGGGVLWDRSVFSAINVVSGDSIQFTYTVSVSAGG